MHKTKLRRVGGSIMLAVPPTILELLDMQAGMNVGMAVEGGRLVIETQARPRYMLGDLLAQCDPSADLGDDEKLWLDSPPEGGELI